MRVARTHAHTHPYKHARRCMRTRASRCSQTGRLWINDAAYHSYYCGLTVLAAVHNIVDFSMLATVHIIVDFSMLATVHIIVD